jgi:hypothetical protein
MERLREVVVGAEAEPARPVAGETAPLNMSTMVRSSEPLTIWQGVSPGMPGSVLSSTTTS